MARATGFFPGIERLSWYLPEAILLGRVSKILFSEPTLRLTLYVPFELFKITDKPLISFLSTARLLLLSAPISILVVYLPDLFFLNEIEAHANHGDTEQQVKRTQGDSLLAIFVFLIRNQVTEADGRKGYEAEISAVQQRPSFPILQKEM